MSWVPRIGADFAGYRLEGLIGHGGMSIVYRAEHLGLGRTVALKLLEPHLSEDASFRERFTRESRLAAALDHPNIIPIFEAGEEDGVFYIAMRYVEGSDLKSVINREGPLDPQRTASIISQVASGLSAAHAKDLLHRDIKPANILIASGLGRDESDHVYLSDFGVAKQTDARGVTKTGVFVGTADYASPEQIEGKTLDPRADIYSLGCVLFECLSGGPVYDKDSEVALMYAHLLEPPPSITAVRPELPTEIDDVLAKGMAKSRDDRYASVKEFAAATRAALSAAVPQDAVGKGGETQLAQQTVAAESPSPTAATPAPPPAAAAPPGQAPPAVSRLGASRWWIAAVAILVAAVAGLLAYVLIGGDDSSTATPTTPTPPKSSTGLAAVVPNAIFKNCKVEAKPSAGAVQTAVCTPSATGTGFYPDRLELSLFANETALQSAYDVAKQDVDIGAGSGRCDGSSWLGEGEWFHAPASPGVAGKAGGRRFCYFEGNNAVMVWTHGKFGQASHAEFLATAREGGSDHPALFSWWRFWHHRIGKCAEEGCVAKV